MKDADYAYAVGVIRSRENTLLTGADYINLIRLHGYKEAADFLRSKGYSAGYEDLNAALNAKATEVWSSLEEILPDTGDLNFLIMKNDFHNLKAALKSRVMGLNTVKHILRPSILDPDTITEAVFNKKFDLLPAWISECAEKAYDILVRTEDSLLADSYIDRCCLDGMYSFAVKSSNSFIKQYTLLNITYANIKTAYRLSRSGRSREVYELALSSAGLTDRNLLTENGLQGTDELMNFLGTTPFSDLSAVLEQSVTQYEKECDERLLKLISSVRNNILGPEPVIAYYVTRETELLNLRIIMFCKHNGIEDKVITERIRNVYV